ncbi:MAG: hypothetical protein AAF456_16750 [Planctomycetota bacterium]
MNSILVVSIVALALGIAAYNYWRQKKVREVAEGLGLAFLPQAEILAELAGSELTNNSGHSRKCVNCFGGDADGISFKVFEYQFWTGYGRNQVKHSQTICKVDLGNSEIADFTLHPKSMIGNLFKPVVNKMSVDPAFDGSFNVSSVEPLKARPVFTDSVKRLIQLNRWTVESCRGRLMIYRDRKTIGHRQLKQFLTDSLELMTLLEEASRTPASAVFPQVSTGSIPVTGITTH